MSTYRVLIVDDEFPARKRLCRMLEAIPGFTVAGEARNGKDGLRLYQELEPDIILADIEMPVMNGLEMIRRIRENDPEQIIIILSCYESFSYAQQAIRCHVQDYLVKDMTQEKQLEEVLRRNTEALSASGGEARDLLNSLRSPGEIQGISAQSLPEIEKDLGQLALSFLSHNFNSCRSLIQKFSKVAVQGFSQYCFMQYVLDMLVTWLVRECAQYGISVSTVTGGYQSPIDVLIREESLDAALGLVLSWLQKLFDAVEPVSFSPRIRNLILYISDHYAEDLSLQSIADDFHISSVHLSRSFKTETGKNIISYINLIRIEKSKLLLASGHYQVSEIAYSVGFHNIQNFYSTFKKTEGISPSEYTAKLFPGG